ncbi:MAG: hypothetical protein L6Q84_08855 [Polyangiaceae bacterium]|nr:hypothetical protein [Polyangiaceae bacterium]
MPDSETARDDRYFKLFVGPIRLCAQYKPKFGKGRKAGLSIDQFRALYAADPFYSWLGLDSPLMYAAHKAAGGMTSIYRQIGIGGQRVFQHVLRDSLGLSETEVQWSYTVEPIRARTKKKTLTLDGRIDMNHVRDAAAKQRVASWLTAAKAQASVPRETADEIKGAVFEVRQGYKSKDSKRQNADIDNIGEALLYHYQPVVLLLSTQIDGDVADRYVDNHCLMLLGTASGTATDSTYVFCREVAGYDLAGFFERNSKRIKAELEQVLATLLEA